MCLLWFTARPSKPPVSTDYYAHPLSWDYLLLILQVHFGHLPLLEALLHPQAGSRPLPWVNLNASALPLLSTHQCLVAT